MLKILVCALMAMSANAESSEKVVTLTSDNLLVLEGPVNDNSVGLVMQRASEIDSILPSGYPMYLFLYTPGGSIQAGLELIEFLSGLNRPVHTVTMFAASMGFQIVQHMGDRYIARYGVLMSHKAKGRFGGEFGGTRSQLDTHYGLWLRRVELMDKQTVSRTNGKQTLESYLKSYDPELWLNGSEAVSDGYADSIVVIKCDASLDGVRKAIDTQRGFSIGVTKSACPAKTGVVDVEQTIHTNQGLMSLEEFLQNNGKFGTCEEASLCASNPELDLETIIKATENFKNSIVQSPKKEIVYSY